jgi:hypothetical protein
MKYQLIALDARTNQPKAVEVIDKALDMKSKLQRDLFLSTINSLDVTQQFRFDEEKGHTVQFVCVTPKDAAKRKPQDVIVYEPESGLKPKTRRTPRKKKEKEV